MNMQTIEGRFIYFTECNLTTLEMLERRRTSSKSDIRRQRSICEEMLRVVKELNLSDEQIVNLHAVPRVVEGLLKKSTSVVADDNALQAAGFVFDPTVSGRERWTHPKTGTTAFRQQYMTERDWGKHKAQKIAESKGV